MQRDLQAISDGALGGAVGTTAMSAFMLAAGRLGLMGEHPPEKIVAAALDAAGVNPRDEKTQDALAGLLHFGFGMSTGALFAVIHRRLPARIPGAAHGMVFGSIVWALSYQGWVPALGIMPPASRDRPARPVVMFLAHLIFGAMLGNVVSRRTPPPEPDTEK